MAEDRRGVQVGGDVGAGAVDGPVPVRPGYGLWGCGRRASKGRAGARDIARGVALELLFVHVALVCLFARGRRLSFRMSKKEDCGGQSSIMKEYKKENNRVVYSLVPG